MMTDQACYAFKTALSSMTLLNLNARLSSIGFTILMGKSQLGTKLSRSIKVPTQPPLVLTTSKLKANSSLATVKVPRKSQLKSFRGKPRTMKLETKFSACRFSTLIPLPFRSPRKIPVSLRLSPMLRPKSKPLPFNSSLTESTNRKT
jgi:hypothetical protein